MYTDTYGGHLQSGVLDVARFFFSFFFLAFRIRPRMRSTRRLDSFDRLRSIDINAVTSGILREEGQSTPSPMSFFFITLWQIN